MTRKPRPDHPWRRSLDGKGPKPAGGSQTAPEPAPEAEPTSGLVPGVEVRITLTSGHKGRGSVVAVDHDAIAIRRHPEELPIWVEWPEVRSLQVGSRGRRRKPGKPTLGEAIRALVVSRADDGGVIRASEAYAILRERFGATENTLRQARRNAGVTSFWDPLFGEWYWRIGPSAREEDDIAHGLFGRVPVDDDDDD